MPKLSEVAKFIKSANAGASKLTFDIGFDTLDQLQHAVSSGAICAETIAPLFRVRPEDVAVYAYLPALMIKITIPRPVKSGGVAERDFDGVQQFAPLLDLVVPEAPERSAG